MAAPKLKLAPAVYARTRCVNHTGLSMQAKWTVTKWLGLGRGVLSCQRVEVPSLADGPDSRLGSCLHVPQMRQHPRLRASLSCDTATRYVETWLRNSRKRPSGQRRRTSMSEGAMRFHWHSIRAMGCNCDVAEMSLPYCRFRYDSFAPISFSIVPDAVQSTRRYVLEVPASAPMCSSTIPIVVVRFIKMRVSAFNYRGVLSGSDGEYVGESRNNSATSEESDDSSRQPIASRCHSIIQASYRI